MPTLKLTQAAVENLKPPTAGYTEHWDNQCPGIGLRVYASGRKTFRALYRVNGKLIAETIGTTAKFPNVAEARARARESLQKAEAGINPVVQRQEQAEQQEAREQATLGSAIDRYLAERPSDRERRPVSAEYLLETTRTLTKNVKQTLLGSRPIAEITSYEIRRHVRAIAKSTPSQGNHVLVYLKAMLGWAVDEVMIDRNPAIGVKLPAQRIERERTLDDNEIQLFWRACEDAGYPFGTHARLLLLAGQRRDEVAQMTWAELNPDNTLWTLPSSRTKNGRAHLVHLAPLAKEILDATPRHSRWVFSSGMRGTDVAISSFSKSRLRIAAAMQRQCDAEIERWTLHDLRRTAATGMASIGIAPHVIDRILNHSSGMIRGVAKIYNRFEYLADRAAALEAWARHIEGLMRQTPSNVLEFAAAQR